MSIDIKDNFKFAERLKKERERLRLKVKEVAEIGGVGTTAQSNYEKGDRFPDAVYLQKLSVAGFDIAYLISGDDQRIENRGSSQGYASTISREIETLSGYSVSADELVAIPVSDQVLSAQTEVLNIAENKTKSVNVYTKGVLRSAGISGYNIIEMRVLGSDLEPALTDGASVLISANAKAASSMPRVFALMREKGLLAAIAQVDENSMVNVSFGKHSNRSQERMSQVEWRDNAMVFGRVFKVMRDL